MSDKLQHDPEGKEVLQSGRCEHPETPSEVAQASSSEEEYKSGYQRGRASMQKQIRALELEINQLKSKSPTQDECVTFLINRAEVALNAAKAILGIP